MANKALIQAILTKDPKRIKAVLGDIPELKHLIFLRQTADGNLIYDNGKAYTMEEVEQMFDNTLNLLFVPASALSDEQIERYLAEEQS
jgi:hypothetical protein